MFVIAVYDISTIEITGQSRLTRVMKTMRQYLHHTQKSVFEGDITQAKFMLLKNELKNIISSIDDSVIFYCINDQKYIERDSLGKQNDPNNVIL